MSVLTDLFRPSYTTRRNHFFDNLRSWGVPSAAAGCTEDDYQNYSYVLKYWHGYEWQVHSNWLREWMGLGV